jgi:aspartate/methionine/tyrosine aminotransferase
MAEIEIVTLDSNTPADIRRAQADRLFSAATYSDWVREGMRLRSADASIATLFESTISEPLPELIDVVRDAFSLSLSPRYVSVFAGGNRFAVQALAHRYGVDEGQVLTTTGATSALDLVLKSLVDDGDHVLIETPSFDLLAQLVEARRARVETFARRAPDFAVDLDDLASKIGPRTRAIVLTSLHNPSGVLTPATDLLRIAELADKVGAQVIVDEVYADFARPAVARAAATLAPNLVTVSSLTKVYGLFALKFGWICASREMIARVRARSPEGDIGVSKLSHAVATHVLEAPEVFDLHWKRVLAATRPIADRHLRAMAAEDLLSGELPEYGCMAFPKVAGVDDTLALAKQLWIRHGLLVAPGEFFGLPGHIRLGFGSDPATLDRNLEHLRLALRDIQPA